MGVDLKVFWGNYPGFLWDNEGSSGGDDFPEWQFWDQEF